MERSESVFFIVGSIDAKIRVAETNKNDETYNLNLNLLNLI